uniref:Uncharacterized protein n=1 Tax=Avena sativa TaxID=4498 RepID=A0ACD5X5R5_AVESA
MTDVVVAVAAGRQGGSSSSPSPSSTPPCAACKLLRRRCSPGCVFAPYFPGAEPHRFASVHKVFGASNISKLLQEVPVEHRGDAVSSLVYEANARVRDPIYGCVGAITSLQRQVESLQAEMIRLRMASVCAARRNGGNSSGGGSPSSMSPPPAKTAGLDWKPTPDLHVPADQHNVMELEYARLWSF